MTPLSKSRFLSGLQCHKKLWWEVKEPLARELVPDEVTQAGFDTGKRIGKLARERLGAGVFISAPEWDNAERIARTQEAVAGASERIYEAMFEHQGVVVAVDALEKVAGGYRLIEVKSSSEQKPEHLPDVAVQRWVLEGAGVKVVEAGVMHLDRECQAPDLSNLFARTDITEETSELLGTIGPEVQAQQRTLAGALPVVEVGDHCKKPQECPFWDRCWKDVPKHHVGTLMNISKKKKEEFKGMKVATIDAIPLDYPLTDRQEVQRNAVRAGARSVNQGALKAALVRYDVAKAAFLDFETVGEAVPVWDGCHPYDQIPVQMSCHVAQGRSGAGAQKIEPFAWIAEGPGDPRPECARQVVDACRGADIVVVWHESMERGCLERLALGVPALAAELATVIARLVDLKKVVEAGVYDPEFLGSYSLKPVVGALLPPEESYSRLPVGEGMLASVRLRKLMFEGEALDGATRDRMRKELLDYCGHDTLVMVKLLEQLRLMAQ